MEKEYTWTVAQYWGQQCPKVIISYNLTRFFWFGLTTFFVVHPHFCTNWLIKLGGRMNRQNGKIYVHVRKYIKTAPILISLLICIYLCISSWPQYMYCCNRAQHIKQTLSVNFYHMQCKTTLWYVRTSGVCCENTTSTPAASYINIYTGHKTITVTDHSESLTTQLPTDRYDNY